MAVTVSQLINGLDVVGQDWTPVWSGAGTPPAIGDGTITGRYFQLGKLVIASLQLTAGASTTFGSSSWSFTLPVTAATTTKGLGIALATDTGIGWYSGGARIESSSTMSPYYAFNGNTMTASHPHAWAATDTLDLLIIYEAA